MQKRRSGNEEGGAYPALPALRAMLYQLLLCVFVCCCLLFVVYVCKHV